MLRVEVAALRAELARERDHTATAVADYASAIKERDAAVKRAEAARDEMIAAQKHAGTVIAERDRLRTFLEKQVPFLRGIRNEMDTEICPDGAHIEWCSDLTRELERIAEALAPAPPEGK